MIKMEIYLTHIRAHTFFHGYIPQFLINGPNSAKLCISKTHLVEYTH